MFYTIQRESQQTGAVADTFITSIAIIVADTAGHRMRIRELHGFPDDATPVDEPILVRMQRIPDLSAGSAGTSSVSGSCFVLSLGAGRENGPIFNVPTYAGHDQVAAAPGSAAGSRLRWSVQQNFAARSPQSGPRGRGRSLIIRPRSIGPSDQRRGSPCCTAAPVQPAEEPDDAEAVRGAGASCQVCGR